MDDFSVEVSSTENDRRLAELLEQEEKLLRQGLCAACFKGSMRSNLKFPAESYRVQHHSAEDIDEDRKLAEYLHQQDHEEAKRLLEQLPPRSGSIPQGVRMISAGYPSPEKVAVIEAERRLTASIRRAADAERV